MKASSSAPPPSPPRGETARSGFPSSTGWINACSCCAGARNTGIAIRDRYSLAPLRAAPFELAHTQKKVSGPREYSSRVIS